MSCPPFDLKDYFFGELNAAERAETDAHLTGCATCREELRALSATKAALMALPEEEPPRRIAFVSDKVFEPRWWQRLWTSGPQLGFAGAAMLSVAIVLHAFVPERAAPPQPAPQPAVSQAAIDEEVSRRVKAEVAQAVADIEARQAQRTVEMVNARLQDARREQRQDLLAVRDYLERMEKRSATVRRVSLYGRDAVYE